MEAIKIKNKEQKCSFSLKDGLLLLAFVGIGFLLRLWVYEAYVKYPSSNTPLYIAAAKNIVQGLGYVFYYDDIQFGMIKQPMYSLSIAFFHLVVPSWQQAALVVSLFFQSLLIVPIFILSLKIANKSAAYIAAILYLGHAFFLIPHAVYTIFDFFLMVIIIFILKVERNLKTAALLGGLFSLLWLTRHEALFYILLFGLIYILKAPDLKKKVILSLVILAVFLSIDGFSNLILNPGKNSIDRIKYRVTFTHYLFQQHAKEGEWNTEKTEDMSKFLTKKEALTATIVEAVNDIPKIYAKQIGSSISGMFYSLLNIQLFLFFILGLFFIRYKFILLLYIIFPFTYAPILSVGQNAQYTHFSGLLMLMVASCGIEYLTGRVSLYGRKFHKELKYLFLGGIMAAMVFNLAVQRFPLALKMVYSESDYQYKRIFSNAKFKEWIKEQIPEGSTILAPENITVHLFFNNYKLYMIIKDSLNGIIQYAKKKEAGFCILDSYMLETSEYKTLKERLLKENKDFRYLATYESEGKAFHLVAILK